MSYLYAALFVPPKEALGPPTYGSVSTGWEMCHFVTFLKTMLSFTVAKLEELGLFFLSTVLSGFLVVATVYHFKFSELFHCN